MDASNLNNFDYIIFSIIGISTLLAFLKGFIKTCLSFISWVLSLTLAYMMQPLLVPFGAHYLKNAMINNIACGIVSFIIVLIAVSVLNDKVLTATASVRGGLMDRSFGVAGGLLRGCFISAVIFWLIQLVFTGSSNPVVEKEKLPKWVSNASSYGLLTTSSGFIYNILPHSVSNKAQNFASDMKKKATHEPKRKKPDQKIDHDQEEHQESLDDLIKTLPEGGKDKATDMILEQIDEMNAQKKFKVLKSAIRSVKPKSESEEAKPD